MKLVKLDRVYCVSIAYEWDLFIALDVNSNRLNHFLRHPHPRISSQNEFRSEQTRQVTLVVTSQYLLVSKSILMQANKNTIPSYQLGSQTREIVLMTLNFYWISIYHERIALKKYLLFCWLKINQVAILRLGSDQGNAGLAHLRCFSCYDCYGCYYY